MRHPFPVFFLLISFFSEAQIQPDQVTIARDEWGVPHIFAKTDPEVAYGLAWAHSEDDFKTIQQTALAGKGMLGRHLGKGGAPIDYVVGLLKTKETAEEKLHTLSPEFKALAQGYIDGLNAYAKTHPEEVLVKNSFPLAMNDYLSSILLSLSVISGADDVLSSILNGTIDKSTAPKGSNAFAIAPWKTEDGSAFLNINSHQPLEGPVAWYEAHLHSENGWNMLGGLFPGGCVIFHGTNENLGWAHTVNHQDKIDVYKLETKGRKYRFDGEWKNLEKKRIKLNVKLGFLTLPIGKRAYWSVYGPTLKTNNGFYSIRMGANQDVRGIEQWYRMNKASNFTEFYKAMEMVAIPGFNTVYADKNDTIFYVSNGKIPIRKEGYDWQGLLPGNTSETLWTDYHPLKDLPQYLNPKSGYLFNTNNTVFHASGAEDNLDPKSIDPTMGYPLKDNNRSTRFVELIEQYKKLNYEDFKRIKYDAQYPSKFHFPVYINALESMSPADYPEIQNELEMIQKWDRKAEVSSQEATFFAYFLYAINERFEKNDILTKGQIAEVFKSVKTQMIADFGSTQVQLGDVQKLVRGSKEFPLWGLPDVLRAMYTTPYENGKRKGIAGESYIQLVRYKKGELPKIESVINYGASNHPESLHYADQAPLFIDLKLKPMTLDKATVLETAERVYSPR
ncbi:penicillin acylase family protein [Jiulongibacter sediminis]|uniref:Peptidase S45 n=1 Tax=Jiulongibacter sediminis TaxID=1605367 RepID=A0A0N8H9V8_9BACT|nr:penicillin acylase family protein [Jiulongibacter sediminis]KPM48452.1 peptidase S45 [Jiulongibacter sediminis]TBX24990.1 peptidase S45 [Jiulongibacter sediminis]